MLDIEPFRACLLLALVFENKIMMACLKKRMGDSHSVTISGLLQNIRSIQEDPRLKK